MRRWLAVATGLGLFCDTTDPLGARLRARAVSTGGAVRGDLEFVQVHPTALDTLRRSMPPVSEAVGGPPSPRRCPVARRS